MSQIRKHGGKAEVAGPKRCRLVVSTAEVDRAGDVVVPEGADLTAYTPNPVLMLHHDLGKHAVGTVSELKVNRGRDIVGVGTLHCKTDESRQAWELVEAGVLRGVSVGFRPMPGGAEPISHPDGRQGHRFSKWQLDEISLVSVPCNPSCLATVEKALASNELAGRPLAPIIRKSLEMAVSETKAMSEMDGAQGGYAAQPGQQPPQPDQPIQSGGDGNDISTLMGELTEKLSAIISLVKPATPAPVGAPGGGFAPEGTGPGAEGEEGPEGTEDGDDPFAGEDDYGDELADDELDRYRRSATEALIRRSAEDEALDRHRRAASALRRLFYGQKQAAARIKALEAEVARLRRVAKIAPQPARRAAPAKPKAPVAKAAPPVPPAPAPKPALPSAEEISLAIAQAMAPAREAAYRATGKQL